MSRGQTKSAIQAWTFASQQSVRAACWIRKSSQVWNFNSHLNSSSRNCFQVRLELRKLQSNLDSPFASINRAKAWRFCVLLSHSDYTLAIHSTSRSRFLINFNLDSSSPLCWNFYRRKWFSSSVWLASLWLLPQSSTIFGSQWELHTKKISSSFRFHSVQLLFIFPTARIAWNRKTRKMETSISWVSKAQHIFPNLMALFCLLPASWLALGSCKKPSTGFLLDFSRLLASPLKAFLKCCVGVDGRIDG